MKQKVYMIMLFLSSIIVVSCNPEKKTSSETVRNLNPSEEPLQETPIYKHVEIIKLETSPVSLISNVNRIEMNDSIIFVSEFGKLYTFTREGKFVSQISRKGEGPGRIYCLNLRFYIRQ